MPCPGNDTIAELAVKRLRGGDAGDLDKHLADCPSCRQIVVALAVATLPRLLASGSAPTEPAETEPFAPSATSVLLAGTRVGRYVIDRLLGAGGMGLVYSARDPELDRAVALKLIHPHLDADPSAARRQLLAEGQAMARLRHPNVIVVHDVGDHGAQVFIAMELVEGETLRGYFARPRSWRETVRVLIAAGRGLAAAHAVGLVHRDFKPENVLVGRDGRVCVSDFGLARTAGAGDGSIAGTPAYMAPEQRAGADPDPRADQYSFALTAYEALAGERPGEAELAPTALARGKRGANVDAECDANRSAHERDATGGGDAQRDANHSADEGDANRSAHERDANRSANDHDANRATNAANHERATPRSAHGAARAIPRAIRRAIERGLSPDPAARFATMDDFVVALERGLGARKRMIATIASGAVLAGVAATALVVARAGARGADDVCEAAGVLPSSTWSPPRAEALRAAFVATRAAGADVAGAHVASELDRWATAWAGARHGACVAARVNGVESQELLDLRMACLDNSARRVGALVDALAKPTASDVAQAIDATARATDLAACTGPRALLEAWRAPPDPAARAEADDLRGRLAKAQTAGDLARYPESASEGTAVADRAAAHGLRGVEAEAARIVAEAKLATGDTAGARVAFDRAVVAAEAVDHARLRVLSYCGLARIEGLAGNVEAADRYVHQARAIVDRLGDAALNVDVLDVEARVAYHHHDGVRAAELAHETVVEYRKLNGDDARTASLLEIEGIMLDQIGKAGDARARFEEELALRERVAGRDSPTLISALDMLAVVARSGGKVEESIALLQRASAIVAASKLTSPSAIGIDAQLASSLSQAGKSREALALIDKTIPRMRELMPDAYQLQANMISMRGEIEDDGGDPKAALADFAAAHELLAKRGGDPGPDSASILEDEGLALRHLKRWAEAKSAYERALELRKQIGGPDSPDAADCEAGLGEIALEQKDPTTAVKRLERALALRSGPDADPANVAHIRAALDKARAALHH